MSGNDFGGVAQLALDWRQSNAVELLSEHCIHLWLYDLNTVSASLLQSTITKSEVKRSLKIKNEQKRRLYLGGRFGLRYLLSHYRGVDNQDLMFGYGSRGKPVLLGQPATDQITFNYTLSRDKALYAFSICRQLGIDMEVLPRKINDSLMAKRHLTDAEQLSWRRISEPHRHNAMLCCWTRKEAYGKALGVGIRYQMNQVTLFDALHQADWHIARSGLFLNTDTVGMADQYNGVQVKLPVPGMASLVYENHLSHQPSIVAAQLNI